MKITNSEHLVRHIKKDMIINNEKYTHLEINITYIKSEASYYVYFMPLRIEGSSIILLPQKMKNHRLLGVERRSKNNLKKAIEMFNNDIDEFIIFISPIYNTDFTKEDLYIEID